MAGSRLNAQPALAAISAHEEEPANARQAIVGNVNAPTEGVGARKKSEDQPHALGYAPGVTMPRQIEAERVTVPSSGGSGV
jgi:hypothetical protein